MSHFQYCYIEQEVESQQRLIKKKMNDLKCRYYISCSDLVRNKDILRRVNKETEITKTIEIRKLGYFSQVM